MKNIMESFNSLQLASKLVTLLTISAISVNSQLSSPCTVSMVSSFTPCINYITGSSNSGTSLGTRCCNTLKALMSSSTDCACLVLTANVPFQPPINRTIVLSLPQACNIGSLPIACKGSVTPLPAPASVTPPPAPASVTPPPAPGPSSFALSPSSASPSLTPQASKALAATQAPKSEATLQLTPTFPPLESQTPAVHRIRPVLPPPSSSSHRFSVSPSYLFVIFAAIVGFYPH